MMPCKVHKQKKSKKYKDGGKVDNIPALLTEDEYVIRKEAAQKLGYKNLDYMNETGEFPTINARNRKEIKNANS